MSIIFELSLFVAIFYVKIGFKLYIYYNNILIFIPNYLNGIKITQKNY